ncbi:hypothetical protein AOLI_G00209670 [Acnodon oligacanthus]
MTVETKAKQDPTQLHPTPLIFTRVCGSCKSLRVTRRNFGAAYRSHYGSQAPNQVKRYYSKRSFTGGQQTRACAASIGGQAIINKQVISRQGRVQRWPIDQWPSNNK